MTHQSQADHVGENLTVNKAKHRQRCGGLTDDRGRDGASNNQE